MIEDPSELPKLEDYKDNIKKQLRKLIIFDDAVL